MTTTWSVTSLITHDTDDLTDVITELGWLCEVVEEIDGSTYETNSSGTINLPEPAMESFIDYSDVTEAQAMTWLDENLDKLNVSQALSDYNHETARILGRDLPWLA